MKKGLRNVLCCAALAALLGPATASASELGDFCWLLETGTLMRFSVSQSGPTHYTLTGLFDEGDGFSYAIIGEAAVIGATIDGSFTGSLSAADKFKTGIFHVSINPQTLAASLEGIRQVYVRGTDPALVTSAYRTHTGTATPCP